jgi:ubiquinone/menaquinone biosynthesis C-methylase UbiE
MDYTGYVCPSCKSLLQLELDVLCCAACSRSYPIVDGIPDFLAPGVSQLPDPLVQRMDRADRGVLRWMSGLYEGRLWYPLVIRMYLGAHTTSLEDLTRRIREAVNVEQGRVLDAACGTATFSRRVASPVRAVFGIDLSMAMLCRGAGYVQAEGVSNVHLARSRVESLPFPESFFDFAICSGALHLFPDPAAALAEIGRTLKPGSRLVGLTFTAGPQGLVRYAWFRERMKRRGTIRLFRIPELEQAFHQAGFDLIEPQLLGSGVFFTAEKRESNRP